MQACKRIDHIFFALLLSVSVTFNHAEQTSNAEQNYDQFFYPMNDYIIPNNYSIKLIFPSYITRNLIISGESNITIDIRQSTNVISLHYVGRITDVLLYRKYGNHDSVLLPMSSNIECTGMADLQFKDSISPGIYKLRIKYYSAQVKKGIFITSLFINEDIGNDWFFITNFQPIGARYVFPCWDDPRMKATFAITVIDNKNKIHSYPQTPKISTYYLAITLATQMIFNSLPLSLKYNNINTIVYRTDIKSELYHIFEASFHIINVLSSYMHIDTNFRLVTKHILIPTMEKEVIVNWGISTYRESAIIYDSALDPVAQKIEAKRLMTRTLANSWINYMISPSWWTYFWLHEGLAAFFQTKMDPKERITELVLVQTRHESLNMDIYSYMQALENKRTKESFETIFSSPFSIYVKAPNILYMLENIVTPNIFQKGIVKYVNKYKFECATSNDLWEEMQDVLNHSIVANSNYTLYTIMDIWVKENSYPIVKVGQYYNFAILICMDADIKSYGASLSKNWWIPISFTIQSTFNFSNNKPHMWLTPHNLCITLDPIPKFDWIIVNIQQTGYYRVQYHERNWRLIADYLNTADYINIPSITRAQIIDDAYFFLKAKQLDFNIFTKLTHYLSEETDYVAWYPMLKIFEYLSRFLPFRDSISLKVHMLDIVTKALSKLTFVEKEDEHDFIKCLRQELIKWACILDDSECKAIADINLTKHLKDPILYKLLPGWKEWTFCNGLSIASRITWLKFWNRYATSLSRDKTLQLLSCSDGFTSYNFQYDDHLTSKLTKSQDECTNILYYVVMTNTEDNLNIILANFKDHIFYCTHDPHDMLKVLTVIINHVYYEQQLSQIKEFVTDNIHGISEHLIEHAITMRALNICDRRKSIKMLIEGEQFTC